MHNTRTHMLRATLVATLCIGGCAGQARGLTKRTGNVSLTGGSIYYSPAPRWVPARGLMTRPAVRHAHVEKVTTTTTACQSDFGAGVPYAWRSATGTSMVNVAPQPGVVVTDRVPSRRSTIC